MIVPGRFVYRDIVTAGRARRDRTCIWARRGRCPVPSPRWAAPRFRRRSAGRWSRCCARRHHDAGCQRQGVVAVVPLLAFGGHRVEAGVDDTGAGRCPSPRRLRSTNGCSSRIRRPPSRRVMVNADSECRTAGYMTTASTSTMVHTVSRCMVARSWAIGTARTVCQIVVEQTARQRFHAGVVRSPTPRPPRRVRATARRRPPPVRCATRRPAARRGTAGGGRRSGRSVMSRTLRAGNASVVMANRGRSRTTSRG